MPAHITREKERATVRFSYDPDVVEALKVRIPSRFRKWDPSEKCWTVTEPWVSTAVNLMTEHFGRRVSVDDRRTADPPPSSNGGSTESADVWRRLYETERAARQSAQRDVDRLRRGSNGSSTDWAADLYRRLPEPMRDTVYKRLMTALHPDANAGSAAAVDLTKQLNGAFRPPKSGR